MRYLSTLKGQRRTQKKRLCEAQNHRCAYCGERVECGHCGSNEANATFEHVYPKSGKGTDHENNIVIACLDCNQAMGDAPTMHAKIKKMNLIKKSWEKSTKRRKRRMWLVVR